MKLSTRQDVGVDLETAFAGLTDFAWIERQALRRGIEIARSDALASPAPGMSWRARFDWRDQPREVEAVLTELEAPERIVTLAISGGLVAECRVDLTPMSRQSTRLRVAVTVRATSFRGRMLLHTVAMAKGRLQGRLDAATAALAAAIERRRDA